MKWTRRKLRPRRSEDGVQPRRVAAARSEEHTSELQSLRHLVCRLLLEKKKKKIKQQNKDNKKHKKAKKTDTRNSNIKKYTAAQYNNKGRTKTTVTTKYSLPRIMYNIR